MTRFEKLEARAAACGLGVWAWRPGDGRTRYRISTDPGAKGYFAPGHTGYVTVNGIAEAELIVSGARLICEYGNVTFGVVGTDGEFRAVWAIA